MMLVTTGARWPPWGWWDGWTSNGSKLCTTSSQFSIPLLHQFSQSMTFILCMCKRIKTSVISPSFPPLPSTLYLHLHPSRQERGWKSSHHHLCFLPSLHLTTYIQAGRRKMKTSITTLPPSLLLSTSTYNLPWALGSLFVHLQSYPSDLYWLEAVDPIAAAYAVALLDVEQPVLCVCAWILE